MAGDKGMGESSEAASEQPGGSAAAGSRAVFLSYASADAVLANQVCQFLESHGVPCWMAPRDVKPGAAYADAIVRAINEASALVLVLSTSTMASEHVSREVERAASKRKPVVAFRVDASQLSAELEYFLSRSQWIDVPALGMPAALARLAEAVGRGLEAAPTNPGLSSGCGAAGHASIHRAVGTASVAKRVVVAAAVVIVLGVGAMLVVRFWQSKQGNAPAPAVAAISDKSIAVLPFADMSQKKDQEYFGDGMAEEILDLLAKMPGLTVIGRTSSFQFKGKNEDLRKIGTELNAAYVLEGSVRSSGDQVRITAQLINAKTGAHEWSETYDRPIGDVLKLQDAIAAAVVRALEVTVDATELQSRAAVRVPAAYDAYLRGRHAADQFNRKGFEEAVDEYREALRLDPTFARAAAALAFLQTQIGIEGYLPPDTVFRDARASAELAIRLDGTLAIPHAILARTDVIYDWDWQAARDELTKATALQPRDPTTEWVAGELAMAEGNWDEAVRHYNASIALDPLMAAVHYDLATALSRAGRLEQAEAAVRKAIQISPNYFWAHYQLGNVLVLRGKLADALATFQEEPEPDARLYGLALVNFALGRRQASDTALNELTRLDAGDWAAGIATVHAYRGEVDQAFMWLERAYLQKDTDLCTFKGDPMSAKIWPDPRYKLFLRKLNLPE